MVTIQLPGCSEWISDMAGDCNDEEVTDSRRGSGEHRSFTVELTIESKGKLIVGILVRG